MKNHFKFQIILTVSLFFIFVFNSNAQNNHLFNHQSKGKFIHGELGKLEIERHDRFDDAVPQKFLKDNFSEDLLDSVVYTNQRGKFKESFSYNPNKMKVSHSIQIWNTDSGDWQNEKIHTYTYDDAGNLVYEFQEFWFIDIGLLQTTQAFSTYDNNGNRLTYYTELLDTSSGQWIGNGEGFTCTYDANNNQLTKLIQNWNSVTSNWEDYRRYTFEYDSNNNLLSELYEAWSNNSSSWVEQWKKIYIYDVSGNQISSIREVWNGNGNPLINSDRITNTFDITNNLLTSFSESWDDNANIWIPSGQYNYSYDSSNLMLTQLLKYWQPDSEIWVNVSLASYTYSMEGNLLVLLIQGWDMSSEIWINNVRFSSTFDNIGNQTSFLSEWWNTQLNDWENLDRKLYVYENGNYLTQFFAESWNLGWVEQPGDVDISNNGYSYSYTASELTAYYNPLTNINDSENLLNDYSLSQNYPNPFNPSTKINFTIPTSPLNPSPYQGEGKRERLITLKVYDILGNEITTLLNEQKPPGTYEIEFNGENLPSGVYFYQITAGSFNQVKKMLLLK